MKEFNINIIILLLIDFIFSHSILSQIQDDFSSEISPRIVAKASPKIKKNKILLRWAPSTAQAWKMCNEYGYEIIRYTITRDSKILHQQDVKKIGVFKPQYLDAWREVVKHDDYAAIMAQSLYGEDFNVGSADKLSTIISLSEEQQQRFIWGLYAAEQNFNVAVMAGLGYIDTDIKANEKYLYKIKTLVPKEILIIKDGSIFTGIPYYKDLPKPLDLYAAFSDKSVMLSWNFKLLDKTYNNYFVERSEDGKKFNRLHKTPLTLLNDIKQDKTGRIFYIDSIPNNKTYYYRVLGKTVFGELGPASNTVHGKAKPTLSYMPTIISQKMIDDKNVVLKWKFPEEGQKQISGFELNRSNQAAGKYKTVVKDIPPESRSVQYHNLRTSNYFTLTALGKNGGRRTSFAFFVQPVDSIPPTKPKGLEGKIDSLGIVTLKWKANTEKDILGYRIYRGNNKDEEYSQITISPHRAIVYYDSIGIHNLNKKIYYKIRAIDQRYNMSESSDILAIKKPDFIPPTKPVFTAYKIKEGKVYLNWINSSSDDVTKHELWRKNEKEPDWKIVYIQTTNNKSVAEKGDFTDKKVLEGETYQYKIIAVDNSHLRSDESVLRLTIPKTRLKPAIKRLSARVNKRQKFIELYWKKYKNPDLSHLIIYKGIKGKKISLFRQLPANASYLIDTRLKPNNKYEYIIRAVFKDGTTGKTDSIIVKY